MPHKGKKRRPSIKQREREEQQTRTYYTWEKILDILFLAYCCVYYGTKKKGIELPAVIWVIIFGVLCIVAGRCAYLFSKAPSKFQKKVIDWHSISEFGIHPYITFALLFLIACVLFWDVVRMK